MSDADTMVELSGDLLTPGENFHGFVVTKRLGRGGNGSVYLVRHAILENFYALKVLNPEVAESDADYIKRFLREARLATRIRHPNLVAVHDCGFDSERGVYYLVMDYVSGSTLRNVLAMEGRLDAAQAAGIVRQVASALQAAQPFRIVHRDIKPENIMIQPDGCAKLVDLGIAKAENIGGESLKTTTSSVFGTPAYISPEQAQCSATVDLRADIYSLGIVFFEMLAGKCPYDDASPISTIQEVISDAPTPDVRDVVQGIREDLAILVRRMTMKDMNRRIGSYEVLLREIDALGLPLKHIDGVRAVEEEEDHTPGMGTLLSGLEAREKILSEARPSKRANRKVWILALAGAALVLLILFAFAIL